MERTHTRALDIAEESRLAGQVAGLLFLAGALTALTLMALPEAVTAHWLSVVVLAALSGLWGLACLTVVDFETTGRRMFEVCTVAALAMTAALIAATGGAVSPARFLIFFVVFYVAYFFEPREALPCLGACVAVHALPLLYEPGAIGGAYAGEMLVVAVAYVLLGLILLRGNRLLLDLRGEAQKQALRDPLTELPNRRAMLDWLDGNLDPSQCVGLVLLDLDQFKDVNTVHGYLEGDRVLCETASTLLDCVRGSDLVARLGGDEFAVLAHCADERGLRRLAERTLEATREMHERLGWGGTGLTASVGWVMYPRDAATIDDLIGIADQCVRRAKHTGKDRMLGVRDLPPAILTAG